MAISLVQSKSGTWTTPSLSLNSATTAGNCLIVMLTDTGGVTATSAAKLGGAADNFAKLEEDSATPGSIHVLASIWADPSCAGGQTAITWTDTGTPTSPTYWIAEFSGIAASSPFDTGNVASGTGGSWSAAFTSTTGSELWLGAVAIASGSGSGTAGNGWTFVSVTDVNSDVCVYGWQVKSVTGTATFAGTGGGTKGWGASVAGLKGAPTGPPNKAYQLNQSVMRAAVW